MNKSVDLVSKWEDRLKTVEFGFDIDSQKLISFIKRLLQYQRKKIIKKVEKACNQARKEYGVAQIKGINRVEYLLRKENKE